MRATAILAWLWLFAAQALAVLPDEILADHNLEARARNISAGLRCLVCQNQSIDDSEASVARDLRLLIREQLQQNKSDAEVVEFVVARYGEFVLLKPRFEARTIALWLSPLFILLAGLYLAFRRKATANEPEALSDDEKRQIDDLIRQ